MSEYQQKRTLSRSYGRIDMEMAAMESSRLEPLLFSDLGGFVVHNVWTWVALLSAALGFFGLRLFPVPSTPSSPTTTTTTNPFASNTRSDDDHSTSVTTPSSSLPDHQTSSDSTTTTTISASTTTTEIGIDGCCTIRRRKITAAYYRDEEVEDGVAEEEEVEEIGVDDDVDFGGTGGGGDDVVMRWQEASRCAELEYEVVMMRMREMGWYKFQDLSVLDGSVVRLWEGGVRPPTAYSCIAPTVAAVADGWLIR
ncbi:hypothetical protein Droror1_Dr00006832 [Drosera rotundifolia]